MALFDSIIGQFADRFGLGDKAGSLVQELLSSITSQQGGGLTGFIDKFKQAGLGEVVNSWIGGGENQPISAGQLESALGSDYLNNIASRVGLPVDTVKPALAGMLPSIVDKLTPGGVIPASLPSPGSLFSGIPASLGGATAAASAAATAAATKGGSSLLKWLPLVLLAALVFFGYQYCNRSTDQTAQTGTSAPTTSEVAPSINSSLNLVNVNGMVKASGVVPDEATRLAILDKLKAAFGEGKFETDIKVDPNAKPVGAWFSKLGDALGEFKIPGAEMSFDGEAIKVGGAAAASALMGKLQGIFGSGANIASAFINADEAVKDAMSKAGAALSTLMPGSSPADLVNALNLNKINFASGKADIPAENQEILNKSAEAIKASSADLRLEVGGHTDSQGNPQSNMRLSEARANSVRAYLIKMGVKPEALMAKGYGDTNPVASNDTEAGRFDNRRIQFSVIK